VSNTKYIFSAAKDYHTSVCLSVARVSLSYLLVYLWGSISQCEPPGHQPPPRRRGHDTRACCLAQTL